MLAITVKDDVLKNDFSNYDCEVSRETTTSTVWKIAIDLNQKVGAMDMCIPTEFTDTEHEDMCVMYHHEATDRLILLRGYVLKSE